MNNKTHLNFKAWYQKGIEILYNRPLLQQKILSGGFWTVFIKGFSVPINLGVTALLARLLSPDDMGVYFYVISLMTTASTLGMLGMGRTLVRLVAASLGTGEPENARLAVQHGLLWGFLGATLISICMAFFGAYLGVPQQIVMFVAVWSFAQTIQNLLTEILLGFSDIQKSAIFKNKVISNFIILNFLLFEWLLGFVVDLRVALIIIVSAVSLSVLISLGMVIKKFKEKIPSYSTYKSVPQINIFRQALPILGVNTMNIVRSQIGIWVVAAFLSNEEIALFGSANRLVFLVSLPLMTIVNAIIPPIIAELYAQEKIKQLEKVIRKLTTIASVVALFVTLIFVAGGQIFLRVIYGDFYAGAWLVLGILASAQLINVASGSCGLTLNMTGNQKTLMNITIVSTLLAVLTTIFTARIFGMIGVAIATALILILENVLMIIYVRKTIGIKTYVRLAWK